MSSHKINSHTFQFTKILKEKIQQNKLFYNYNYVQTFLQQNLQVHVNYKLNKNNLYECIPIIIIKTHNYNLHLLSYIKKHYFGGLGKIYIYKRKKNIDYIEYKCLRFKGPVYKTIARSFTELPVSYRKGGVEVEKFINWKVYYSYVKTFSDYNFNVYELCHILKELKLVKGNLLYVIKYLCGFTLNQLDRGLPSRYYTDIYDVNLFALFYDIKSQNSVLIKNLNLDEFKKNYKYWYQDDFSIKTIKFYKKKCKKLKFNKDILTVYKHNEKYFPDFCDKNHFKVKEKQRQARRKKRIKEKKINNSFYYINKKVYT